LDLGSLQVRKKSGSIERFHRRKLVESIRKATVQDLASADLNDIADRIIEALFAEDMEEEEEEEGPGQSHRIVDSNTIGIRVLEILNTDLHLRATRIRYALLFGIDTPGYFSDAKSFMIWMKAGPTEPANVPRFVVKRRGSVEQFDESKLTASIRVAAKKRPNSESEERASDLLGQLIYDFVLEGIGDQPMVTSGQLASEVLRVLHPRHGPKLPVQVLTSEARELAYLRVASTAKAFVRPEDFVNEASSIVDWSAEIDR
jgi:transcriptional regulator NrdR family protein